MIKSNKIVFTWKSFFAEVEGDSGKKLDLLKYVGCLC